MIDGANSGQILLRIFIPAAVPAIITVALFAFITSWNEFLGALVMMNTDSKFTLPLILSASRTETSLGGTDWGMLQAGRDHLDRPVRRHLPAPAAVLRRRVPDRSREVTAGGAPVVPSRGRLRPLGLGEVEITGGAWAARQEVNADATLAHCHGWMERLGWVANFTRAADGTIAGRHEGMMFADSDVFKLMEAMAWEVGRSGSPDADARFRQLTDGDRPRPGGRRLPQHGVRAGRPAPPLLRPRVGSRAVQRRPPAAGGRRPGPHDGRRRVRRHRPPGRRPRLRHVRAGRDRARRRPSRGRARARRARPGDGRAALPRPGRPVHRSAGSGHARRDRLRPGVLPGRRPDPRRRRCSAGTPCGRCTSPPARSTSPSRRATTRCSRR